MKFKEYLKEKNASMDLSFQYEDKIRKKFGLKGYDINGNIMGTDSKNMEYYGMKKDQFWFVTLFENPKTGKTFTVGVKKNGEMEGW